MICVAVCTTAVTPCVPYHSGMASVTQSGEKIDGLGTLVLAALVLLLAWQLAYWTWRFAAPDESRPREVTSVASVDPGLIAALFGAPRGSSSASSASTSGLRLKGVVAPTPGTTASAVFARAGGRDIAVFIDGEAQPGVKLAEVHPDHVIVTHAGVRERIDLETPRATQSTTTAGRAGPGFRVNVARAGPNSYTFARKDLDDALRDPNQLNYLGQIGVASGGGVRMDAAPAGSLASKLGLQPGDVIRRINGQAVASPGDLARLYQQFATTSTVTADVERGGSVVQLSYRIQ
jgi:general secretion pathway protein C